MHRARTRALELAARAREPIDGASVVVFRVAFGLLLAERLWRELRDGVIEALYLEPQLLFPYDGFEWVRVWPGDGLSWHVGLTALAALGVALGALYRVSALVFTVGFAYLFLLDQSQYLNHDYLIVLFGALLACVPAHRQLSIDARLRPAIASSTLPRGALWMLRAQMAIVYFYAGLAKLNGDWLRGAPLEIWLAERADMPLVGPLLAAPFTAVAMSWSGALIDLCAAPLLLSRRARWPMFVVLLAFHLLNAQIFSIGVFPWLSIAATTLFFEPDWPRRIFRWRTRQIAARSGTPIVARAWTAAALLYLSVQVLVPLRHLIYPGEVSWTEEGHRFAWHMMLRHKEGQASFFVRDPVSGAIWTFDPSTILAADQLEEMVGRPPMIHALAREIARRHRVSLGLDVEVRARVLCSLNGRPARPLVDERVDLAHEPARSLAPARWILPLED